MLKPNAFGLPHTEAHRPCQLEHRQSGDVVSESESTASAIAAANTTSSLAQSRVMTINLKFESSLNHTPARLCTSHRQFHSHSLPFRSCRPCSRSLPRSPTFSSSAGETLVSASAKVLLPMNPAILEECFREPRKPGLADVMRDCPISVLSAAHVQMLRDRKAEKKGAANNRLKYLSALFGWAIEARHMARNPARDVRPLQYASSGFYTWTLRTCGNSRSDTQ